MFERRYISVTLTLTIVILVLMVACGSSNGSSNGSSKNQRGFDITGTWSGRGTTEDYELEITINSVDFTKDHESISGNAIFSYNSLNDDWRGSERKTIHLSDSDFAVRYIESDYTGADPRVIIGFSFGKAISQGVGITFYENGAATYNVHGHDEIKLSRK